MRSFILCSIFLLSLSLTAGSQARFSNFCSPYSVVLQILPEVKGEAFKVKGRTAITIGSAVFIPAAQEKSFIGCWFDVFQQNVFLNRRLMIGNNKEQVRLNGIDSVRQVLFTRKTKGQEVLIKLPAVMGEKMLQYFLADYGHTTTKTLGFDCFALASLISNVVYNKHAPPFNYQMQQPKKGGIIILTKTNSMTSLAVIHWAVYLGDDIYLSKLGKNNTTTRTPLVLMDLRSLMRIYECNYFFVATPKINAKKWSGYNSGDSQ